MARTHGLLCPCLSRLGSVGADGEDLELEQPFLAKGRKWATASQLLGDQFRDVCAWKAELLEPSAARKDSIKPKPLRSECGWLPAEDCLQKLHLPECLQDRDRPVHSLSQVDLDT